MEEEILFLPRQGTLGKIYPISYANLFPQSP
jgi:hypothetical protein